MNIVQGETIFTEKFRPKTLNDIILPEKMKSKIQTWITNEDIPNMLLVSKQPGVGKTTLAHVLINETQADALFINISLDGNIDTLRTKIQGFVTTSGFSDIPKIVVLDEFDGASQLLQKALRGFTEEFSKSARFILTANYKEKIIEPLCNRLQIIDFDVMFKENKPELIRSTAKRIIQVLKYENISFAKDDLLLLVKSYYPSTRSMLITIQEHIENSTLVLSEGDIDKSKDTSKIIAYIKSKDFEKFRKAVQELSTPDILFYELYNSIEDFDITKRPQITILIARYSYQNAFARDAIVNIIALGAEIMQIL